MNYETWLHEHDILIANEAAFKTETETKKSSYFPFPSPRLRLPLQFSCVRGLRMGERYIHT